MDFPATAKVALGGAEDHSRRENVTRKIKGCLRVYTEPDPESRVEIPAKSQPTILRCTSLNLI
jgi:hypothetical protein